MNALNSQLQDVQRIMVQNIDDVLQRGTVLSGNNIIYVYILYINLISFKNFFTELLFILQN